MLYCGTHGFLEAKNNEDFLFLCLDEGKGW